MNDDEKYKIIGYVIASKYRLNILKSLNDTVKTPSLSRVHEMSGFFFNVPLFTTSDAFAVIAETSFTPKNGTADPIKQTARQPATNFENFINHSPFVKFVKKSIPQFSL